jgi:ATP-binding protein involved in chromosome partitioning
MKTTISMDNILLTDTELAVKWSDKTESFIDLKTLRNCCPCAFCSGETDVFGNVYKGPKKKLSDSAYQATKVEKIGHYALRIYWGDRHTDGLYTYEMLRKLGDT